MLVLGKVLGTRVILDYLLLACLPVLNVLFVSSTNFRFPIISLLTISILLLSMCNVFYIYGTNPTHISANKLHLV